MKKTGKDLLLKILIPLWYRILCLFHKPSSVLFLEIRYDGLTDNLRLLYEAFKKKGGRACETYLLRTGEGSGFSFLLRCFRMLRYLAGAELIFVDESSDILACVPLRRRSHVIQCWHACGAFKRFGHGIGTLPREYYGPYAFATVSSPYVIPFYADAMHQSADRIRALGVSRTDRFFDPAFTLDAKKRVGQAFCPDGKKKLILYAPTFRGNVADAKSAPLPDLALLQKRLGDRCVLLCKWHPACRERLPLEGSCADFCFDVTDRFSIEELLAAADYCITDYSSLVFEYALFLRPIFFYVPDLAVYGDERGFYVTARDLQAGPLCEDTEALADALAAELDSGAKGMREETAAALAAFRERFMSACDGHATERILREAEKLTEK